MPLAEIRGFCYGLLGAKFSARQREIYNVVLSVRIEDVILVTENGAKLLSTALPREPERD